MDHFVSALKAVGLKADVIIRVLQAVNWAIAFFGSLIVYVESRMAVVLRTVKEECTAYRAWEESIMQVTALGKNTHRVPTKRLAGE